MKKIKSLLPWTPEVYFILSSIYYWTLTPSRLNPIAITFVFLLTLQIFMKNKIMGMIISILFIVINLFMVFALLSEFSEFPIFNDDAKKIITFGSIYLGLNLIMSTIMVIKYIKGKTPDSSDEHLISGRNIKEPQCHS